MKITQRISVVMSVFNGEKNLSEAIESILNQSFHDFEFLIIDDGSTDSTPGILSQYRKLDPRVLVHRFERNQGLSTALNYGFERAHGEYIARMDADDISLPGRLKIQALYLDVHPEVGICGTWARLIGDTTGREWKYPVSHEAIYARMLFANTLIHSSVMLRSSLINQHGLYYDSNTLYAQDYELWSRAALVTRIANIDSVLLQYRVHKTSSGARNLARQDQVKSSVHRRMLSLLGVEYKDEELHLHAQVSAFQYESHNEFFLQSRKWLEKLLSMNNQSSVFSPRFLSMELGTRWTQICAQSKLPFFKLMANVLSSPLPFRHLYWVYKRFQNEYFTSQLY